MPSNTADLVEVEDEDSNMISNKRMMTINTSNVCIKLNAQSEERKSFVLCRNELVVCLQRRGAHLCRCRSGWERIFVAFVYQYVAIYLRWLVISPRGQSKNDLD